jgi:putative transposase
MARVVIPGVPHHVTQRGDRREDVFLARGDYQRYLSLPRECSAPRGLEVIAYCAMPNHVHLVAVLRRSDSLATVLKPVHLRLAQYVNWTRSMAGRRWQGRFFSCPLDDRHTATAVRYVELNPVRAGLVREAESYQWSSAAAHAGLRNDDVLTVDARKLVGTGDWRAWLREPDEDELIQQLRLLTRTGRPFGEASFVDKAERVTGRLLRPRPAGRPKMKQRGKQESD